MSLQTESLCEKVTMPIYEVPIWLYKFMPTMEGSMQGIQESSFLVEAPNKTEARKQLTKSPNFWKNYNKASPEERKNLRSPFRLKREGEIKQVPECELRHKNSNEDYTCGKVLFGEYNDSLNGEFGMCVIDGFDAPEFAECPCNEEYINLEYEFEKSKKTYKIKSNNVSKSKTPETIETLNKKVDIALNDLIKKINRRNPRKITSGRLELELE